jgi:hypothetical protein
MWESFKSLETESNLENFISYYKALSSWVLENKKHFGDNILRESRLDVLIKLEPSECVINETELLLEMEHNRMFGRKKPKHLESIAHTIGDTLWCLATIDSGIDCPNCIYDDGLRYVMIEDEITHEKKLALSCESCKRLQTLEGEILSREGLKITPANRNDIKDAQIFRN